MDKKYTNIILWILVTVGWTIITLLLSKWLSISKGYLIQNALFFVSLGIIIVGFFLIMGRGTSRAPVEFTGRSHPLLLGSRLNNILTNNNGKRNGYDYTWKLCFNGYSILFAGILCILIDVIIVI